jgi:O-antigen ligase
MNEARRDPLWLLVAAAALLIPLAVWPHGYDVFRLPKEAAMRAIALLLCVVWTYLIAAGRGPRLPRPFVLTIAAGFAWLLVATAFSTQKLLSAFALFWIFQGLVFFVSAYTAATRRSVGAVLAIVLSGSLVNALVAVVEARFRWYPFPIEITSRRAMGLMGNANDLGELLFGPLLFAVAVALAVPRLRRGAIAAALLLLAGIGASVTITTVLAVIAGLAAMVLVYSFRRGAMAALILIVFGVGLAWFFPPMRARVHNIVRLVQKGRLDEATSNRITPTLTAWRMIVASPVTGLGPGTFGYQYFLVKPEALRLYPRYLGLEGVPQGYTRYAVETSYGEAHNEFVETTAEAGVPALLILIAALVLLGAGTFRPRDGLDGADGERADVARYLSLPLAVAIAAASLAQFPLQIAGSYVLITILAGVCVAWSWRDA